MLSFGCECFDYGFSIGSLKFQTSKALNYNYAVGISAYTCFFMEGIYILLTVAVFIKRWDYIEHHKRVSILTYLLVVAGVMLLQIFAPEIFVTSIAATVLILGVYMNQEDPAMKGLARYHDEMVMGFATLVENKDDSTGGHVKRTTIYVEKLAEELRKRGYYTETLTRDYMKNLKLAAPMHDIGKISIPDAILQKPGKLTNEEFTVMKSHAANGGKIIQKTFGKLQDLQYRDIAFQVARYHHEKWNGKGYPEGLKENEIPICARIMAVADVFDAVSEKRCYREAMPMEECFEIIRRGSGQDFDPVIAEIFLEIRDQVEKIHAQIQDTDMESERG